MSTAITPIALRTAKTLWSFGHSECNRVKKQGNLNTYAIEEKRIKQTLNLYTLFIFADRHYILCKAGHETNQRQSEATQDGLYN